MTGLPDQRLQQIRELSEEIVPLGFTFSGRAVRAIRDLLGEVDRLRGELDQTREETERLLDELAEALAVIADMRDERDAAVARATQLESFLRDLRDYMRRSLRVNESAVIERIDAALAVPPAEPATEKPRLLTRESTADCVVKVLVRAEDVDAFGGRYPCAAIRLSRLDDGYALEVFDAAPSAPGTETTAEKDPFAPCPACGCDVTKCAEGHSLRGRVLIDSSGRAAADTHTEALRVIGARRCSEIGQFGWPNAQADCIEATVRPSERCSSCVARAALAAAGGEEGS